MNITNITVRAGRTFNNPREQFANLRPEVELTATLAPGDDAEKFVRELQGRAEALVEDHKNGLLKSIEELHQLSERQSEVYSLQQGLQRAQERLDEIRKEHPELKLLHE